jgi:hypothetical protein
MNLDAAELELVCPRCGFVNEFTFGQARLRDVIICRGCKSNIHLDDVDGSVQQAKMAIEAAIEGLKLALS